MGEITGALSTVYDVGQSHEICLWRLDLFRPVFKKDILFFSQSFIKNLHCQTFHIYPYVLSIFKVSTVLLKCTESNLFRLSDATLITEVWPGKTN